MPGFITHYICGQAILNTVSPDAKNTIQQHQQLYNIGTQGPDIFFYYIPGLLKKRSRDIGTQMHKHHFGAFIGHMIDSLIASPESERPALMAYISGFLTHYALDASAHPYVYSKTGVRQKGDTAKAIKYSVNHRKFETAIDVLMLDLMSSKQPSDYKLWELINVEEAPAQIASDAMSAAIHASHQRYISPKEVYRAMVYMINITWVIQSRKGRRKRFMELIENLTIGEALLTSIVHMQEVTSGVDYMNIAHSPWGLPGTEARTESFVELYGNAVSNGAQMIDSLWGYIQGNITKEGLMLAIGDRSLSTGFAPDESVLVG